MYMPDPILECKPPRADSIALRNFESVDFEAHDRLACSKQTYSEGMRDCIPTRYCYGKDKLPATELALLAYILDNPEDQGSRAEIAEACDCAANSIPRAAKRLEERGLIERVKAPGFKTIYRVSRNLHVTTTRNAEVTCNAGVTTPRNPEVTTRNMPVTTLGIVAPEAETTPKCRVVTAVTTSCEYPPPYPPKNITPTSQVEPYPEKPELGGEGVSGGDLFDPAPTQRPPRKRKAQKFVATDDTLPREPTPEMLEIARERGLINGTLAVEFSQWRRWHIREGTVMSYPARSFQTWVNNWANKRAGGDKGKHQASGLKLLGIGPDGKPRYQRKTTYYVG